MGSSNIDFRSQKDLEKMRFFNPWFFKNDFGTMGNECFHQKFKLREFNKKMSPAKNLITTKEIAGEIPNPKYYDSAKIYSLYASDKGLRVKKKSLNETERVANLDESFKGKEIFTGDSMMIASSLKQRKQNKLLNRLEKLKKEKEKEALIVDKSNKNKEAMQETQLVKIEAHDTLEGKIDIAKIKEIRLALRRRYASRTNLRKIFKEWDTIYSNGEIDVYEAHDMINRLGIPINFNETRALIASSNKRNTESLNMEEFMHLIFNDNQALNLDLGNLHYKDERLFTEEEGENLKEAMTKNLNKDLIQDDALFINEFLRTRIPLFVKNMLEVVKPETKDSNLCNYTEFCRAMRKFVMPSRYLEDVVLDVVFNNCKEKLEDSHINYKKLVDTLIDSSDQNNFFNFKDRFVKNLEQKIDKTKKELTLTREYLETDPTVQKHKQIDEQIDFPTTLERRKTQQINDKITESILNPINSGQPSGKIALKFFEDSKNIFQRMKTEVDKISPDPVLIKNYAKTRFNGNPRHQNTFTVCQAEQGSPQHISEKERFNKSPTEFQKKEKEKKAKMLSNKLIKIKSDLGDIVERNLINDIKLEKKDTSSLIYRTRNMFTYENRNKQRNFFLE